MNYIAGFIFSWTILILVFLIPLGIIVGCDYYSNLSVDISCGFIRVWIFISFVFSFIILAISEIHDHYK